MLKLAEVSLCNMCAHKEDCPAVIGFRNGQRMLESECLWWRDQAIAAAIKTRDPDISMIKHITAWTRSVIWFACLKKPPWVVVSMCDSFERKEDVQQLRQG